MGWLVVFLVVVSGLLGFFSGLVDVFLSIKGKASKVSLKLVW